jgi:[protein-PII] uridylyltransferase
MAPPLDRASVIEDPVLAGLPLCRAYSDLVDRWIAALFAQAGSPPGVALLAVGGYGRAELSPQSDIDLVLVHDPKLDVAATAEQIWYPIWDEGLKLGHAVRTVKGAVAWLRTTSTRPRRCCRSATSPATGPSPTSFTDKAAALWRKRAKRFLAEMSMRVKDRHTAAGEVAFLLEPDLKEGRVGCATCTPCTGPSSPSRSCSPATTRRSRPPMTCCCPPAELHRRTGRPGPAPAQEQDGVADALGYADADA